MLARLRFVNERVPARFAEVTPGAAILAPKKNFAERFPDYVPWLLERLGEGPTSKAALSSVATLEARHGEIVTARWRESRGS